MVGPLFDDPDAFPRDHLAERLRQLAAQNIYIGGSSWKYEGWLADLQPRSLSVARALLQEAL